MGTPEANPNPSPATQARGARPCPVTGLARASQERPSPQQATPTLGLHAKAHKGYQHHGFSCFFFLRPITATPQTGRIKEAKRSWGKTRRKSPASPNQPPPPRPAGNRHKMADSLVLSPPPVSPRGESWGGTRDAGPRPNVGGETRPPSSGGQVVRALRLCTLNTKVIYLRG